MSEFPKVKPFPLVRDIATAGPQHGAIYLLICKAGAAKRVEADLAAEIDVQLDAVFHTGTASQCNESWLGWRDGSIRVLHLDEWLPSLIRSLDRHAPLLVQDGGQLLLIAEKRVAERVLRSAPNLRNRLTGVFQIEPDELSAGDAA